MRPCWESRAANGANTNKLLSFFCFRILRANLNVSKLNVTGKCHLRKDVRRSQNNFDDVNKPVSCCFRQRQSREKEERKVKDVWVNNNAPKTKNTRKSLKAFEEEEDFAKVIFTALLLLIKPLKISLTSCPPTSKHLRTNLKKYQKIFWRRFQDFGIN